MKEYRYTSDEPAGIVQLDSVLSQMGQRSREAGAKWDATVTKDDDGSINLNMSITPAPKPPDLRPLPKADKEPKESTG